MNKNKSIINEDIVEFKKYCEKDFSEKEQINILRKTIKQKNKEIFKIAMESFISPEVFWSINKELIKI